MDNSRTTDPPELVDLTNSDDDDDVQSVHNVPTSDVSQSSRIKIEPEEGPTEEIPHREELDPERADIDQFMFDDEQPNDITSFDDSNMADELTKFLENANQQYAEGQSTQDNLFNNFINDGSIHDADSSDDDNNDAIAQAAFDEAEKAYTMKKRKNKNSMQDDIEHVRRLNAEEVRQKNLERRQAFREEQTEWQGSIYALESNDDIADLVNAPDFEIELSPPAKKRKTNAGKKAQKPKNTLFLTDDEESGQERPQARKRARTTGGVKARDGAKAKPKTSRAGAKKRSNVPNMLDIGSLIHTDIVGNAAANYGQESQPVFTARNKSDALKQLIASIPDGQKQQHSTTTKQLNEACKQFSNYGPGSMRADGNGEWLLKGMKSSLFHYQLLGCAWMVARERGKAPYGGMISDAMGYGKTVSILCCMVENKPKLKARNRTTLIVCPSSLCSQWMNEIEKHVKKNELGKVLLYRSGNRLASDDPIQAMRDFGVIITTYNEVMRHYPKCQPPEELVSEKLKQAWWTKYYEENKGVLLKIPFHRVVLDEAHCIKNYSSRTSKACRVLTSKYKWVASGTPITNRLEELYPYFEFLGIDGAGNFEMFKKNYGKRSSDKSMSRLDTMLRKVMIRRTGADKLFDRPIVSLPQLSHETIKLEYSALERAMYQIVKARFVKRINEWSAGGNVQQHSSNIFVMLTRLRQMAAHTFLVLPCLKHLLEVEDLQKLWRLTENEDNPEAKQQAIIIRKLIAGTDGDASGGDGTTESTQETQNTSSHASQFRSFMKKLRKEGNWAEMNDRKSCHSCRAQAVDPVLAIPCGHLYCRECIDSMLESTAACKECSQTITKSEELLSLEDDDDDGVGESGQKISEKVELNWAIKFGAQQRSVKTQAVVEAIKTWMNANKGCKIIVFSLWVTMLRILEKVCKAEGWGFSNFDGRMNPQARDVSLRKFKEDPKRQILLASLQATSLGLNVTEARFCIIVDPWWNAAAEAQAFSRCYRIGQKQNVEVKRFVVNHTVDTQVLLQMQERKTAEIERVIDGRSTKNLSMPDLLRLFGPVERDFETGQPIISPGEGEDEDFIFGEDQYVHHDSDGDVPESAPNVPW